MTALRVGIAGYGTVGRIRHQCIDAQAGAHVVAISDQSLATGLSANGDVRQFSDYQSMIQAGDLDVVFVALPNYLAAQATIAALESGSHVFCEKPPARNLVDLEEVRAHELMHPDLHLMYGFNHRFHPSVKRALEIILSGELGSVIDLRGVYGKSAIIRYDKNEWRCQRRFAGGGILLDQGIHMVDMMRLFGGEFAEVHSVISNRHWQHDVEDNAYAIMRSETGVVAMIQSSATQWRHRFQLDITLTKGALALSGILSSTRSYGAETISIAIPSANQVGDPTEVTTKFSDDTSWQEETDFYFALLSGPEAPTRASSLEAVKTMELVYAIYDADETWRRAFGSDWAKPNTDATDTR